MSEEIHRELGSISATLEHIVRTQAAVLFAYGNGKERA